MLCFRAGSEAVQRGAAARVSEWMYVNMTEALLSGGLSYLQLEASRGQIGRESNREAGVQDGDRFGSLQSKVGYKC